METPGSPAAPFPAVVVPSGAATDEEKAEAPGGSGGLASSGGLV
eukprot:COSAG01_NODE_1125_length_11596_cov_8.205532_4_plen_44_part_00